MSDFEDKLNSLLSNPESMNQIMELAKKLGVNQQQPAPTQPSAEAVIEQQDEPAEPVTAADPEPVHNSGIDPALISGIMQVLGNVNVADDRHSNLINALKPYLKDDRQERLDKAIMVAQLAKMARSAMLPPESGGK